jgi:hypothetical protein
MAPPFNFDLNTPYEPTLGGGQGNAIQGVAPPPNNLSALLELIMPYLLGAQQQRSQGVNTLVRGLQTLRGGGVRDSLTGSIRNPDPLVAQQEHDAYWDGLFTSPEEAIAKERKRFDPQGLRPGQKTFTEQGIERMNQTPQQRVNAAMGPGWETMSPTQRRVALQQRHGQVPDFQDPTGGRVAAGGQAPAGGDGQWNQLLAATLAGPPSPLPTAAAPQAQQAPLSAAPTPPGPPQASAVSPMFDINDLLKAGPTIRVDTGQNTQGYVTQPPMAGPPGNPWMHGVGTMRGPMDFTPNPTAPPLPNFQYGVGNVSAVPQPWRYGVGSL